MGRPTHVYTRDQLLRRKPTSLRFPDVIPAKKRLALKYLMALGPKHLHLPPMVRHDLKIYIRNRTQVRQAPPPQLPQGRNQRGGGGGRKGGGRRGSGKPPKVIILNKEPVKPLVKSANAWQAGDSKTEKSEDDGVSQKMTGVLNKLTFEKFDRLSQQFMDVGITSRAKLQAAIKCIFVKALDEEFFCPLYAQLCVQLSKLEVKDKHPETGETEVISFSALLLTKCQLEFQRITGIDRAKSLEADQDDPEANLKIAKAKRHLIGYMKFLGELYNLEMIQDKVMFSCIRKFLSFDNVGGYLSSCWMPEEADIECLCKLLTTTGPKLEQRSKDAVNESFGALVDLPKQHKLSSRIRFMIQDLVDLRQNRWKSRRVVANPTTIAEEKRKKEAKRQGKGARRRSSARPAGGVAAQAIKGIAKRPTPASPAGKATKPVQDVRQQRKQQHQQPAAPQNNPRTDQPQAQSQPTATEPGESEQPLPPEDVPLPESEPEEDEGAEEEEAARAKRQVLDRHVRAMLDEFLNIGDLAEVKLSLTETEDPDKMHAMLEAMFSKALDGKDKDRAALAPLLRDLLESRLLGADVLLAVVEDQLETLPDMQIDIPFAPKYFGAFLETAAACDAVAVDDLVKRIQGCEELAKKTRADLARMVSARTLMQRGVQATLDEYLDLKDANEVKLCLADIKHPDKMQVMADAMLLKALDGQQSDRQQVDELLSFLLEKELLSLPSLVASVRKHLVLLDDYKIDIPFAPKHLACFVATAIEDPSVGLGFIQRLVQGSELVPKTKVDVMCFMLARLRDNLGASGTLELLLDAKLEFKELCPSCETDEQLAEVFGTYKIADLLTATVDAEEGDDDVFDEPVADDLQVDLLAAMEKAKSTDEVEDWIEENVSDILQVTPSFVRQLTRCILELSCKAAVASPSAGLSKRDAQAEEKAGTGLLPLLKERISGAMDLQLHILCTLQTWVHDHKHPKGLTERWFILLFRAEAVDTDVFLNWRNEVQVSKQAPYHGKDAVAAELAEFFEELQGESAD